MPPTATRRPSPTSLTRLSSAQSRKNPGPPITLDPSHGFASVYDIVDGKGFGSAVVLDPTRVLRMEKLPATDSAKHHEHAAVFTRVAADGRVSYRTGFAWSGDNDLTAPDAWLTYLQQTTAKPR